MIGTLQQAALRPKVRAKLIGKLRKSADSRLTSAAAASAGVALPLFDTMDDDILAQIKKSVTKVQNRPENKFQGCMDDLLREYQSKTLNGIMEPGVSIF